MLPLSISDASQGSELQKSRHSGIERSCELMSGQEVFISHVHCGLGCKAAASLRLADQRPRTIEHLSRHQPTKGDKSNTPEH